MSLIEEFYQKQERKVNYLIIKPIEYPQRALQLEALISRLKVNHESMAFIKHDYQLIMAGFRGEMAVDYPLSFLREEEYIIMHDLRLWNGKYFFQIDILILHAKYILILEVKNMVGEILIETDLHQMIQVKDDEKTAYADPLLQVSRLKSQLHSVLENAHFHNIPIFTLVVFSNTKSIIRIPPAQLNLLKNKIVHKEFLPELIPNVTSSQDSANVIMSPNQMKKISKYLIKKHTPFDSVILEKYHIKKEDIITGIICGKCSEFAMKKLRTYWFCQKCHNKTNDAIFSALRDYYFLFGEEINNEQLRFFLHLDSKFVASRILKSLPFKRSGKGKSTVHHLTPKLFKEVK